MRLSFLAGTALLVIGMSNAAARVQTATPIPQSATSASFAMAAASGFLTAQPLAATAALPLAPKKIFPQSRLITATNT